MARRREEEFYCTECKNYFLTFLRDDMWGNYTIVCPVEKCNHHHFRVIKDGLITEDRHNEKMGQATLIHCLKSTISAAPYHNDPVFRQKSLRAYEGGR